jgi:hypothetical protein
LCRCSLVPATNLGLAQPFPAAAKASKETAELNQSNAKAKQTPMPKADPHFDAGALLAAVAQQDVGLAVSTNNPEGFRRILYGHMRAQPSLRAHVYADPRSRSAFYILRKPLESLVQTPEQETPDEQ